MCGTCGCGDDSVRITKPGEKHHHEDGHTHDYEHGNEFMKVLLQK